MKAGLIELFKGTVDTPGRRGDEVNKRIISFVRLLEEQKPGGKVPAPSHHHLASEMIHLRDSSHEV